MAAPSQPGRMPSIRLGDYQVSRLIIGANPFYGYSHFNRLYSAHMADWSTPERVCETLTRCQGEGINTWQLSHSARSLSDLKRHRAQGGKMQWILLTDRGMEEDPKQIAEAARLKPIGIVHHGGSAERRRRSGEMGKVREFLSKVRDIGVMAGLSAHDPRLIAEVESAGWNVDFYMCSLYYLTRTADEFRKVLGGVRPLGEIYLPGDPETMLETVRQTRKTCLCYKVLAAGRLTDSAEQIDRAFQFTFEHIKPQDAIIVGMYPRFSDQVRENAERTRRWAVRS